MCALLLLIVYDQSISKRKEKEGMEEYVEKDGMSVAPTTTLLAQFLLSSMLGVSNKSAQSELSR